MLEPETDQLVDSYGSANVDTDQALYSGAVVGVGQSFTPSKDMIAGWAKFWLKKVGAPTGNVVAKLYRATGPATVMNACDSTTDWTIFSGTMAVDSGEKVEGSGSIRMTADTPAPGETYIYYNPAGTWDWSKVQEFDFWAKGTEGHGGEVYIVDSAGSWRRWGFTYHPSFTRYVLDFDNPTQQSGAFDPALVNIFRFDLNGPTAGEQAWIDWVRLDVNPTVGVNAIPSGPPLATSVPLSIATLTTSYLAYYFMFINPPILGINDPHVVTCEYSGGNATNYLHVGCDASAPSHAGNYSSLTGTVWTENAARDLTFWLYEADSIMGLVPSYQRIVDIGAAQAETISDAVVRGVGKLGKYHQARVPFSLDILDNSKICIHDPASILIYFAQITNIMYLIDYDSNDNMEAYAEVDLSGLTTGDTLL
jgi:hypothetical protein